MLELTDIHIRSIISVRFNNDRDVNTFLARLPALDNDEFATSVAKAHAED